MADATVEAVSTNVPVVLVVDDDSAMRSLFEIYLRSFGYRVLVARDGEEAVRFAVSDSEIDLMITDVVMPGLSGQELVDQVRAALPGLRVLFCSGHPAREMANHGIDLGASGFLQKPCRPADLEQQVRDLLSAGRA
ncbi:MAG: response regulator [Verrucomicrobiota bacterium]|nr:response regulator [Verrucomicrobiota bacterium]